jgi:K+-sensing histidine kinase KdpD
MHPDDRSIADRAIESIKRQSWRLSRLVEHLLLAMDIRMGEFKFAPKPFDLSALLVRSVSEIQPFFPSQVFNCRIEESVKVLGDEALLEHGIWTLFTCASAVSSSQQPLEVGLRATPSQARLTTDVRGANLSAHDIQSLFLPFGSVEYENRSGIRNAVGLYLSQQIAHLHNGRLEVSDRFGAGIQFLMEIPR